MELGLGLVGMVVQDKLILKVEGMVLGMVLGMVGMVGILERIELEHIELERIKLERIVVVVLTTWYKSKVLKNNYSLNKNFWFIKQNIYQN